MQRYLAGENVADICLTLGCSRAWLYKWVARSQAETPEWAADHSRRPKTTPDRTPEAVEQAVQLVRLELAAQGLFCGAQAIRWHLEDLGLHPLPSVRTIHRILQRHAFTQPRAPRYAAKGKRYPALVGTHVNRVHQSDFVGPCYLEGPTRFYSLNTVDLATGRCGTEPLIARGGQHTIDAFWALWQRLGMPAHQQVDNDMIFYGSPAHPRGMGSLIRLCLQYDIEPWFIPPGEPWRNGVIEKFNDQYRQKFLARVHVAGPETLAEQAHHFEHRHNQTYRYSKLRGRTPMEALAMAQHPLRFPPAEPAPRYPLKKPETGQYHVVRFIRSDGLLNVFGEHFPVPPEALYEYVIATIVVEEQMLTLSLDQGQIDQIAYPLF